MIIPRTTTSKHYPRFIRENKTLKNFSKQKKVFERIGLPNCESAISKTHKIVFSGGGDKGLWDIATMSMRGISSCQRWDSSLAKHLIGSMVDPYCGIIYITNGNEFKLGEKMLKRAIVRFVANNNTGQPALFLERIYPVPPRLETYDYAYYAQSEIDRRRKKISATEKAMKLFCDFLKEKTNNKLPVLTSKAGYSIPSSNAVENVHWRSYRDSDISYHKFPKYNRVSKVNI